MNPDTDRVQVPTNGRGPHPPTQDGPAGAADAAAQAGGSSRTGAPDGPGGPDGPGSEPARTDAPAQLAVTPAQLAVGFGIVASLVLLLVGRRRRRRG